MATKFGIALSPFLHRRPVVTFKTSFAAISMGRELLEASRSLVRVMGQLLGYASFVGGGVCSFV